MWPYGHEAMAFAPAAMAAWPWPAMAAGNGGRGGGRGGGDGGGPAASNPVGSEAGWQRAVASIERAGAPAGLVAKKSRRRRK